VESDEHRKDGYTLAADLWSLGVLTACVLTGNSLIPHKELSQLSQIEIANRFLGFADNYTRNQWVNMAPRAQRFLRKLLTTDPANRMTATEALNHSWFMKPHSEGTLLEGRYHRIIRFWKERDKDDEVIEYLPSWNRTPEAEQERQGPKFRRKIPDTTLSPYFNLDRHLLPRGPANRKIILASLLESGSSFVPSEDSHNKPAASKSGRKERIISANGKDMFGTWHQAETPNKVDDEDEMVLVPTEPMPQVESLSLESPVKSPEVADSQAETEDEDEEVGEARENKRARKESWDTEDRRIPEAASKQIPRYASARVVRDTIQMRKEAERKENMRPSLYAM
jgi:serine/threonine protein kinase